MPAGTEVFDLGARTAPGGQLVIIGGDADILVQQVVGRDSCLNIPPLAEVAFQLQPDQQVLSIGGVHALPENRVVGTVNVNGAVVHRVALVVVQVRFRVQ